MEDYTHIDTRIKSLMHLTCLPHDEARLLLLECNWCVKDAIAKHKQKIGQTTMTSFEGTNVMCPTSEDLMCIEENETVSIASRSSTLTSSSRPQSIFPKSTELSGPRLQRGMSKATINLSLISVARDILLKDAAEASTEDRDEKEGGGGGAASFVDTTEFTFTLPDLRRYTEDMKAFIYKDLIDSSTIVSLEQEGHLNWWADLGVCQRLFPMATSGDGNCLLHAASLGMWGFHDRLLVLRKVLYDTLTNNPTTTGAFYRRWRYQQTRSHMECGLILSEEEWKNEWKFLVQLASPQPRRNNKCENATQEQASSRPERPYAGQTQDTEPVYESLEELHVFVLAHVLRRPIIVIAKSFLKDTNGDALAPIPFGGIYLPIERSSHQCHSSPLLLTYDLSHFSALVSMEDSADIDDLLTLPPAIPLVGSQLSLLPLHFAIDPGEKYDFGKKPDLELSVEDQMDLLYEYFDVDNIPIKMPDDPECCVNSLPDTIGCFPVQKNVLTKSDSEESCPSGEFGKEDVEKKSRVTQFIVKSIVKPIDNIGTKIKKITKGSKVGKMERKPSIGMVTQSTRTSNEIASLIGDESYVICAKLHRRKTRYQNQMIENYLETIEKKFREQQIQRREQHAEMRRLSVERFSRIGGGGGRGGDDCRAIFPESERNLDSFGVKSEAFCRQNTIVVAGKSKFYTTSNEDQCPSVDVSVESRRSEVDSTRKTDRNSKNYSGLRVTKYNKLDTMQLEALGERTEISNDGNGWLTLPRKNTKYEGTASNGIVSDFHHTQSMLLRRDPVLMTNRTTKGVRVTADPSTFRDFYHQPNTQKFTGNGQKLTVNNTQRTTGVECFPQTKKAIAMEAPELSICRTEGERKRFPVTRQTYERIDQTVLPTDKTIVQSLCLIEGCTFYGTSKTDFLCSKCHREQQNVRLCLTRDCKLPGDVALENLCSLCYQKKQYSCRVQYPTAKTKL